MSDAIALLDVNNAYVSMERLFDRALHKQPVAVLSNNDGCIISRSQEVKDLNVPMGAPLHKYRCVLDAHEAQIMSSNYELYGELSDRVMSFLTTFTPAVEVYSIDEAFMLLAPGKKRGGFDALGREIKDSVYKNLGLPVCVGVGETKTLAKVANKIAKKSDRAGGVVDLYRSPYLDVALARTKAEDVWGIGPASARKLAEANVRTAYHLREMDVRRARQLLTVTGARTILELKGQRCIPLEVNPQKRKSMTASRTFGQTLTQYDDLREAIDFFVRTLSVKLRRLRLAARQVTVFISTNRFHAVPFEYSNSAVYRSAYLSDIDQELEFWAINCLKQIYREGFEYAQAGVHFGGLAPSDQLTDRMFDETEWDRFRLVMRAVDEINRKWGRDTVRLGAADLKRRWQPRAARRSRCYTTRLSEIMAVK